MTDVREDRFEIGENVVFFSNVQPKRRTREKGKPWSCCGRSLGGFMKHCPECGKERPS